jgi:hypothetical protein
MTIPRFGNIMPIHGSVLSLIGWHLSRRGAHLIAAECERIATMRGGHRDLKAETGQDFGFDLAAWRKYLLANSDSYNHPYAFARVDQVVREAIADPEFARLAEAADSEVG